MEERAKQLVRSRVVSVVFAVSVLLGGMGALTASGAFNAASSPGSAARTQYRPGKGCGDKNHQHARGNECGTSARKKKSAR